jgi:hypothetical protein
VRKGPENEQNRLDSMQNGRNRERRAAEHNPPF